MKSFEQIIDEFKNKCQTIFLNHTPINGSESIGGISRINTVVTGMGAQLSDIHIQITEEVNNILRTYPNHPEIDESELKDSLLAVGKEMIAEYLRNIKLK